MAAQNAGLLFVHHGPRGWQVLLGRRAGWLRYGARHWQGPGGAARPGEDPLTTAFRETSEEWCGGRAVEELLDGHLPPGFDRESLRNRTYAWRYPFWVFHTFLVELNDALDPAQLRLNDEFTEAAWFSVVDLPVPHPRSLERALRHFNLVPEHRGRR